MSNKLLHLEDLIAVIETAIIMKEESDDIGDDDINEDTAMVVTDRLGSTADARDIAVAAKKLLWLLDRRAPA
ncbi:hypothetical protein [Pleomorphomonas carboxyditropha]|uniref:Uncharacterized protein n=1 Tax=Pleomorphomonas carboxyditropha TaxID=2023338 RepID=A0A2G9WQ51_9HYPH|nr:hypothetical protein [Pleomorphomonas carboxyditropha]PIO96838.1 hypothetical protein CJ014_23595 [Pleomorphomonas carboxyditropha]